MSDNETITINDSEAEHIYSNLISFNVNPEEVCMGLGIREVQDQSELNVHSYLHMTVPHFLRFAEAVNQQINLLIEKGVITGEPEQ